MNGVYWGTYLPLYLFISFSTSVLFDLCEFLINQLFSGFFQYQFGFSETLSGAIASVIFLLAAVVTALVGLLLKQIGKAIIFSQFFSFYIFPIG